MVNQRRPVGHGSRSATVPFAVRCGILKPKQVNNRATEDKELTHERHNRTSHNVDPRWCSGHYPGGKPQVPRRCGLSDPCWDDLLFRIRTTRHRKKIAAKPQTLTTTATEGRGARTGLPLTRLKAGSSTIAAKGGGRSVVG